MEVFKTRKNRVIFLAAVLIIWFLRDVGRAFTEIFPRNYLWFILTLLFLLPIAVLEKKWRIAAVMIVYFFPAVLIYGLSDASLAAIMQPWLPKIIVLSSLDLFLVASLFMIFLESKPKVLMYPLAAIMAWLLIAMISMVYWFHY